MKTSFRPSCALLAVSSLLLGSGPLVAQTFSSYPQGDDIASSLGQFQIVLDQAWARTFDILMTNSPLINVMSTRHIRLYHRGVFTSPTLYDPATVIGRSDAILAGSPQDVGGVIAGRPPGRAYIRESQMVVRPTWPAPTDGMHEIHTFLKSMHLTDSLTTRVGFSVKAGMQAPARPVCAGQVEAGSTSSDFPANSFFNVYVVVDIPGGGLVPPIQLVNVDPLLVQQTNLFSLPPRLIYIHENSTAVSMYFNTDVDLPDPLGGGIIHIMRGTLFGQLTLAGHGVSFGQTEVEVMQNEIENEDATGTMPINPVPIPSVTIIDPYPDYNAVPPPPTISAACLSSNGAFVFTLSPVTPRTTSYLQVCTDLAAGNWQTLATIFPTNSTFTFSDPGATTNQLRFYRWLGQP